MLYHRLFKTTSVCLCLCLAVTAQGDEKARPSLAFYGDNYGVKTTGRHHAGMEIGLEHGDRYPTKWLFAFEQNIDPSGGFEWEGGYRHFLDPDQHKSVIIGIEDDQNRYHSLGMPRSNRYREANLALQVCTTCSKEKSTWLKAGLIRSRYEKQVSATLTARDELAITFLSIENILARKNKTSRLKMAFSKGLPGLFGAMGEYRTGVPPSQQGGSGSYGSGDFWLFNFDLKEQIVWPKQLAIWIRLKGQWSDQQLTVTERYDLGDEEILSGYDCEYSSDSAAVAKLSVVSPFQKHFWGRGNVLAFVDYGKGWQKDATALEQSQHHHAQALYDYGFGIETTIASSINVSTSVAKPFGGSLTPSDGKHTRIWAKIIWHAISD